MSRPSQCSHPGRAARGASAVVVALLLALVTGFLALAVDVGHLFSVKGELQNAADAGALAGARELDGTAERLAGAVAYAGDFSARHETDSSVRVAPEQVELGHWTRPDQTCELWGGVETGRNGPEGYRFCRIDARDAVAARFINAVRVQVARAEGAPGGGGASVFYAKILGHAPTADVRAEAVAVTGGPCTQHCPTVPLVIRAGCLEGSGALRCGDEYTIGLSSATVDTAGWTTLVDDRAVSSHEICNLFQNGVGSTCAVRADDWIATSNGNQFSATCRDQEDSSVKTLCDWFFHFVGQDMQIPIVEYQGEAGQCAGGYQGLGRVVGFATFRVESAHCKETDPPGTGPCAGYASEQCVALEFVCGTQDDEVVPLGCGWWGTSPLRPMLVR